MMKKTYAKPLLEIYNINKEDEVIVTSGSPLAAYGLGWFVLPQEDFKE